MEKEIQNILEIIMNEINKLKDIVYLEIKEKHLENWDDIQEAIDSTGFYTQINIFKDKYASHEMCEGLKQIIDRTMEYRIEKDQWN